MRKESSSFDLFCLLTNESFVRYICSDQQADRGYWQNQLNSGKLSATLFDEAKLFIQQSRQLKEPVLTVSKEEAWGRFKKKRSKSFIRPLILKAAVVAAVLTIVGLFLLYTFQLGEVLPDQKEFVHLKTEGIEQEYLLADGSRLILATNTEVKLDTVHFVSNRRVELLKGELFCDVAQQFNARFIVVSPLLEVTVFGTQFSVHSTKNFSDEVSLYKGSVELLDRSSKQKMRLKTGEKVVKEKGKTMHLVNTNQKSKKSAALRLNNQELHFLTPFLLKNYNVTLKFESDSLSNRRISGEFPVNNLPLIIEIIETTMQLEIIRNQNQLILKTSHL